MSEQEELQRLRALLAEKERIIERQNLIIEQNDAIAEYKAIIEKNNSIIEDKVSEIVTLKKQVEDQQIYIDNILQALLQAKKKLFGSSSGQTPNTGQLSLFGTVDELAKALFEDQKKITVKEHKKKPRQPGIREEMLAELPKEVDEYVIPSDEVCHKCGEELKVIGKEIVRTEVEFIPAKLLVKQVVREKAKCTCCGTKNSPNKVPVFAKAQVPKPVLPHSISTPSLVAQIMYQKFGLGLPFNRQEKDWYRRGLVLTRANMAHWTIRCAEEWLTPIYDKIHEAISTCEVMHMDETRIQCNKEPGKKASSNSFMWVMRSAASESLQAAYFHYSRTRSTETAKSLIGDFTGILITDAYIAYNKAGDYTRALCWAHCRRYFIESILLDNNGKEIEGCKGAEGREYINLLFKVEKEIEEMSFEEKKAKRQEKSRPILEAFWAWVEETASKHTTNEKLTTALNYSLNQREHLETFMTDGRIPLSNNLCEANIKPFATARRAWLFADTPKGARANAILYTLVESAKANELDAYEYLKYLLEEMPNNNHLQNPEILDKYMPWSDALPDRCRLIRTYKKNFKR